ncbi:MAG: hypothetical protein NXI32_24590 [bacterium]|nr:hypothetical protein [bacterium]
MNLNPLAAGSYGAYTAICGMFLIYKSSLAGWWKFLMYGVVALGIFVIAQSGSRGQLLGFVITSAVWLPVTAGAVARKSVVIALVVTVVAAVAAYFLFGELGWTSRIEGDQVQHSIDFRVNLATELVSTCWSKGIFYVLFGLGNSASYSLIGSYPHLVPLEILAEEGFIGFGLFLSFIIVVFRQLQVAILDSRISRDDRTALCLLACLFTFELLLCLKQGSLMGSTALFSFGLGLTYALKTVGMQFPITATQIKSRTPNTVPRARNSATGRPLEL